MRLVAIGRYYNADRPFADMFKEVVVSSMASTDHIDTIKFTKDDVVLFGGGEDISPAIYKQKACKWTHASDSLSHRDLMELHAFKRAQAAGSKMLGICRGAQLLCSLAGGSLIQHVTNHGGHDHSMTTNDGREIKVCSVHHQMMNPFATKHELIGWASENLSTCYIVEKEKQEPLKIEPEVVYFPSIEALAIQYHPEFMGRESEAVIYARELVQKYLMKG